jgi:nitric oxide dioxygenase
MPCSNARLCHNQRDEKQSKRITTGRPCRFIWFLTHFKHIYFLEKNLSAKLLSMTKLQINTVQETWLSVAALDPILVGDIFYLRLFQICPEVRPMFQNSLPEQSKKLLYMLNYIIARLDKLDDIMVDIKKLAQRHCHYGVHVAHYHAVGSALLWTLEQGLGHNWTEDAESAWADCYQLLATAMINASKHVESLTIK